MGNLADMGKITTVGQLTYDLGISPDRMRKRIVRASEKSPELFQDKSAAADRILSAEQVAVLSGKSTGKPARKQSGISGQLPAKKKEDQSITIHQPAPGATMPPAGQKAERENRFPVFPVFGLSGLLSVVIYAHTALVWYEVALIFGMPGVFAGVILAALKHAAVVASKNPDYDRFTADTLGVAFVLDALAVYAHYTAFREALPGNFAQQMGNGGSFWAACVLAVVVASGAFISLYFINEIRKTK